jgi:hypothetical protein
LYSCMRPGGMPWVRSAEEYTTAGKPPGGVGA